MGSTETSPSPTNTDSLDQFQQQQPPAPKQILSPFGLAKKRDFKPKPSLSINIKPESPTTSNQKLDDDDEDETPTESFFSKKQKKSNLSNSITSEQSEESTKESTKKPDLSDFEIMDFFSKTIYKDRLVKKVSDGIHEKIVPTDPNSPKADLSELDLPFFARRKKEVPVATPSDTEQILAKPVADQIPHSKKRLIVDVNKIDQNQTQLDVKITSNSDEEKKDKPRYLPQSVPILPKNKEQLQIEREQQEKLDAEVNKIIQENKKLGIIPSNSENSDDNKSYSSMAAAEDSQQLLIRPKQSQITPRTLSRNKFVARHGGAELKIENPAPVIPLEVKRNNFIAKKKSPTDAEEQQSPNKKEAKVSKTEKKKTPKTPKGEKQGTTFWVGEEKVSEKKQKTSHFDLKKTKKKS